MSTVALQPSEPFRLSPEPSFCDHGRHIDFEDGPDCYACWVREDDPAAYGMMLGVIAFLRVFARPEAPAFDLDDILGGDDIPF